MLTPVYAQAQAAPQSQQPANAASGGERQWKDRTEYDLYEAARTATDANVALQKLNEWKEKYPTTNFDKERRTLYLTTYAKLNQTQKAIDAAKDLLQVDPGDFTALYYITYFTPQLATAANPPSADALDQAQKAANSLLNGGIDKQFAADKKPANMSDADWKKARTDIETIAHNTLGFVAMQQKNYPEAEKHYKEALQTNPNSGEIAYFLGNAIYLQKKPDQSEALFYIARAATYDGPGALNPAGRQQIQDYLNKAYKAYHGSTDGLDQLKQSAKNSATPPAGFTIETATALAAKKQQQEEEEAKKNPSLTLWKNIKAALTGADGANYFNTSMKDAAVPTLSGKVVKLEPETRPKTIIMALEDGTTPDATLKFDTALPGKVEPGTTLSFEGVPESYTASPFMVTFKVEKDKLHGWTGKGEAPARRPAARRPAARKR